MMVFLRQSVLGLLALVVMGLLTNAPVHADTVRPALISVALNQRVIDLTDTLDVSTLQRMRDQLEMLEESTGSQIAVLMLPSTGEASIEDFANQLFRAWRLGRKEVDDGILLLVAKDDHKVRIEVGYGLEGTVTDLLAHLIIREHIAPAFSRGDYAGGIQYALDDLTALVDGGDLPKVVWQQPSLATEVISILLALVGGGAIAVWGVARKQRRPVVLIAQAMFLGLLVMFAGGMETAMYWLVLPLVQLAGAAVFGNLWRKRGWFYGVFGALVYSTGVVIVSQLVDLSLVNWIALPLMALMVLSYYVKLFNVIKASWNTHRGFFILRAMFVLAIFLAVYLLASTPP